MRGRIRQDSRGNKTFYLDGVEVSEEEFRAAFPDKPIGAGAIRVWNQPIHSEALGVHPDQIPEAMDEDKKLGVGGVEYDHHGRPIFTSSKQFRKYAKAYGKVHKGY